MMELRLQQRKERGLFRSLQTTTGLIDLTSNDYFGFARHPDSVTGRGATGSRLLTGNSPFYEQLEMRIAGFHRAESCLIYNSGYIANLGLISALGTEEVTFLYDVDIHASMIDGMRLSAAKKLPFRHNDLDSLERRLKNAQSPVFVLVESIYSLTGDFAPLQELASLCSKYGANLIVDEAHATGVRGAKGEGAIAELGLESQVFARVHTFSKALGAHGACVLGGKVLKEYLINFSRPLIYTTALPSSALASIESSYDKLLKEGPVQQGRLNQLIAYFSTKIQTQNPQSPIQPIYVPDVRELSQQLRNRGIDVRAILPPTVPRGKGCLRVVLHSFNRTEEIDQLLGFL